MQISINKKTLLALLSIIILGAVVYSNTLNVPFIFDDTKNIKNPALRIEQGSVDEMVAALSEGTLSTRPVTNLSFALNYFVGGYRVQGYHFVNIAIHLLSGVFLYFFIRATLRLPVNKSKYGSFSAIPLLATLLWVAHPLATQSVTYVVQRMNSMAAMFYILSLLFYITARNRQVAATGRWPDCSTVLLFFLAVFSGVLAIGSKEIAVTLPLLIFVYEWFFFQDLSWGWLKKRIYWLGGVVGIFVAFAFYHLGSQPWRVFFSDCPTRDFTSGERLLTQFRVVVEYVSLLLYPDPNRLALDYDFPFSTSFFSPPSTFYSFLGLLCCLTLAIFLARRERLLSFCVLWFFLTLIIESSVICLEIIFEHRTYLPSMLFFLFLVSLLYRIRVRNELVIAVGLCSALLFGYWTFERNKHWSDAVTFWESNINVYPNKARIHNNLGMALYYRGDIERAEEEFRRSIELAPNAAIPHCNLGKLLLGIGERKDAELYLRNSIRFEPEFVPALYSLGILLREKKEYDEAIAYLRTALKEDEKNILVVKQLGNTLLRSGNPQGALPYLMQAHQKRKKDTEVLLDVAEALTNTGEGGEAINIYREVLKVDYSQGPAHFNIALLLQQRGALEEAAKHYQVAKRLIKNPEALLYNYGNQLFRLGRYAEAENVYMEFLQIVPVVVDTFNNLGLLMQQQGRLQEAVKLFSLAAVVNPQHQLALNNLKITKEMLADEQKKKTENGGSTEAK